MAYRLCKSLNAYNINEYEHPRKVRERKRLCERLPLPSTDSVPNCIGNVSSRRREYHISQPHTSTRLFDYHSRSEFRSPSRRYLCKLCISQEWCQTRHALREAVENIPDVFALVSTPRTTSPTRYPRLPLLRRMLPGQLTRRTRTYENNLPL